MPKFWARSPYFYVFCGVSCVMYVVPFISHQLQRRFWMKGSRVKQTEQKKKVFFFSIISGHFRLIKINLQKRHKKYYNKLFIEQEKKYKLTRYKPHTGRTEERKLLVKNVYGTEKNGAWPIFTYFLIFLLFFPPFVSIFYLLFSFPRFILLLSGLTSL